MQLHLRPFLPPFFCFAAASSLAVETQVVEWVDSWAQFTTPPVGLVDAVSISQGHDHAIALRQDGTLAVWGKYQTGSGGFADFPQAPPDATNIVQISAGAFYHSLALRADGKVIMWSPPGYYNARLAAPADFTNAMVIRAGNGVSLGVQSNGVVRAWGSAALDKSVPADLTNAITAAVGDGFYIALLNNHTVRSWGGWTNVPPGLTNVVAISAAPDWGDHALALKSDGTVLSWDQNNTYAPKWVTNAVAIATGGWHDVALLSDGTVAAWIPWEYADPDGYAKVPPGLRNVIAISSSFHGSMAVVKLPLPFQAAAPAVNISPQIPPGVRETRLDQLNTNGVYGWTFRVERPVVVTGFGWFDSSSTGLALPKQVGLWRDATGTNPAPFIAPATAALVTTVAIPAGSNSLQSGPWRRLELLSPITLEPGGYAVAGAYDASTPETVIRIDGTNIVGLSDRRLTIGMPAVAVGGFRCPDYFGQSSGLEVGPMLFLDSEPVKTNVPAGTFANLDFEMATLTNTSGGYPPEYYPGVMMSNALPYYFFSVGDVTVGLTTYLAISGRYSAFLQHNPDSSSQLWQTGKIPSEAKSVVFKTTGDPRLTGYEAIDHLRLTFNGVDIPFSPIAQGTNWVEWAGDVSSLAGSTAEMRFICQRLRSLSPPSDGGEYSYYAYGLVILDDIQFSSQPIIPLIREGPVHQNTFWGGTAVFSATTRTNGPSTFQWIFNGSPIPGATTSSLNLTNVQWDQRGHYSVEVSNAAGVAHSPEANLSVSSVAAWDAQELTILAPPVPQPPELDDVAAIAAGGDHGLALLSNSLVTGWGHNGSGQLDQPFWLTNIVAVAASGDLSAALRRDGYRVVWGAPLPLPNPAANVIAISGGLDLKANGKVSAWTPSSEPGTPGNVPYLLANVVAISSATDHALAVRSDGTVAAWGNNALGQSTVPVGLSNVVAVAAGSCFSLALRSDGTIVGWGWTNMTAPPGLTNIVAIAAGSGSAMALRDDGTVVYWGGGHMPDGLRNVTAISINQWHNLALVTDDLSRPHAVLAQPTLGPTGFAVSLPTRSGHTYRLEYTSSLQSDQWLPLPLVAGNGSVRQLVDATGPSEQRFYRVREW